MQLIQVFALLSALASTSLAFNVYSYFFNAKDELLGEKKGFRIGNEGCFWIPGAVKVSFSQHLGIKPAAGPYCLRAYTTSPCSEKHNGDAVEEFKNVNIKGKKRELKKETQNAVAYRWTTHGACLTEKEYPSEYDYDRC
ncbi:hypothetical protein BDU57DRAFT_598273 [Ampelomyces quisqualis]|uniref:Uncharacterized protein n=1 Tax=Ampelomyces quisqualis TaxID=50730 RepID=A0A6A5Q9T5_AMPQU|nr:hypothetical protein BDU57DRAFT_598273 [Ampelomyces quisqualis]